MNNIGLIVFLMGAGVFLLCSFYNHDEQEFRCKLTQEGVLFSLLMIVAWFLPLSLVIFQ